MKFHFQDVNEVVSYSLFLSLMVVVACQIVPKEKSRLTSKINGKKSFIPSLVASFGDSRSTGAFSNTEAGKGISKENLELLKKLPIPWFLGVILNQSNGLNMIQKIVSKPEVNPFSGEVLYSHRSQFEKKTGMTVDGAQYAVVGGGMETIDQQFIAAKADYKSRGRTADYVVYDFGSVDFLINEDVDVFEKEYENHFETLLNIHPNSRILVLSVPDIVDLMTSPIQAVAVNIPVIGAFTCDKMRGLLKLGDESGLSPTASKEIVTKQNKKRLAINNAISFAVKNAIKNTNFQGKIHIAAPYSLGNVSSADLLTFDCMHPNLKGLESIANETWKEAENHELFN